VASGMTYWAALETVDVCNAARNEARARMKLVCKRVQMR
jgi:hypothetical protein